MRFISNVRRDDNHISINFLNHPKVASDFLLALKYGTSYGFGDFVISLEKVDKAVFPNACVPLAGFIEYYKNEGVEFFYENIPDFVESTCMFSPLNVSVDQSPIAVAPLNRVWKFTNSDEINNLVDAYVDEIYQQAVCEKGVPEGLTWCLNEVMDNVLQHSRVSLGYVMGQIHRSTKHIAFCVFDYGQGIYNSLRDTHYSPRNPIDAITLAVKEGVTRDSNIGQGNGLWGLHNMVRSNSGVIAITSNSASYMLREDEIDTFKRIPTISRRKGSTIVDFQIDFDKGISIAESLGGHTPVNLRLESLEDSQGNIHYKLAKKSSGTGTRQSGERIRNELINIRNETNQRIIIDFDNISVISSSFADELIGKLVAKFGFFGFTQLFYLENMNEIVQSIVNRSVSQRMADTFAPDKYAK